MTHGVNRRTMIAGSLAATFMGFSGVAKGEIMQSEASGTAKREANKALLHRWYDDMWAQMRFDLIPALAGPIYTRHHSRGATDPIAAETYAQMAGLSEPGAKVTDFNYRLVADGDYVGSIGRMVFDSGHQWDWVQMFRIADGKLAETWLPGMGGTDPRTYPRPEAAWNGSEIPVMGPATGNKAILARWYDDMWARCDFDLVPRIAGPVYTRNDHVGPRRALTAEEYRDSLKAHGSSWRITDFRYFLIAEDDLVIATATWEMGMGRQWDWVQAFRIAEGKMVETWLPALGGTDASIVHTPEAKWDRSVIPAPYRSPKP